MSAKLPQWYKDQIDYTPVTQEEQNTFSLLQNEVDMTLESQEKKVVTCIQREETMNKVVALLFSLYPKGDARTVGQQACLFGTSALSLGGADSGLDVSISHPYVVYTPEQVTVYLDYWMKALPSTLCPEIVSTSLGSCLQFVLPVSEVKETTPCPVRVYFQCTLGIQTTELQKQYQRYPFVRSLILLATYWGSKQNLVRSTMLQKTKGVEVSMITREHGITLTNLRFLCITSLQMQGIIPSLQNTHNLSVLGGQWRRLMLANYDAGWIESPEGPSKWPPLSKTPLLSPCLLFIRFLKIVMNYRPERYVLCPRRGEVVSVFTKKNKWQGSAKKTHRFSIEDPMQPSVDMNQSFSSNSQEKMWACLMNAQDILESGELPFPVLVPLSDGTKIVQY